MKISRIFCMAAILIAFASCSQDTEIEEYVEQTTEIVPLTFKFKFADEAPASTRHKVNYGGKGYIGSQLAAYYKMEVGDLLGVQCPDAPENNQQGVYEITKLDDYDTSNATSEITTKSGGIGCYKEKLDEPFRVYYGLPAGKVSITSFAEGDYTDTKGSFQATIAENQTGEIESEEVEGNKTYKVGDWQQAICGGARTTTPSSLLALGDWFTVYALFTAANVEITVPEDGYTVKKVTLEVTDIDSNGANIPICGTAKGDFICEGGGNIQFEKFEPQGNSNKVTLNIDNSGQILNKGDKLLATLFLFPCGPSGDKGHTGATTSHTADIKIGVTYSKNGTEATKHISLSDQPILLRGYNNVVLPVLPEIN